MNNLDKQYIDIIEDILKNGTDKDTRSGRTRSLFCVNMRINLKEGFPLLTTKKVFTKGIIHELLWFLSGDTNIKYLVDNNVHIWDMDAYRFYIEKCKEFNTNMVDEPRLTDTSSVTDNSTITLNPNFIGGWLMPKSLSKQEPLSMDDFIKRINDDDLNVIDKRVKDYKLGDLGNIYGHQWRNWEAYENKTHDQVTIDQVATLIDTLKNNPNDRRMIISAWNVSDLTGMALSPCHIMSQFYTRELTSEERWEIYYDKFKGEKCIETVYDNGSISKSYPHLDFYSESAMESFDGYLDYELDKNNIPKRELSCVWMQRSADWGCGIPFNIASYALLTHMIAQCVNMTVGELCCTVTDCHIYHNHIEQLKEQVKRVPYEQLPKLKLNPNINNIDDFTFDDIVIENYESHPAIKLPLSVGL